MPAERGDDPPDDYLVRPYEPSDLGEFLRLYETVFGERRSERWVEWRYGGPYTDGVRMVVVERDGELVGAEPFISLPVRAGDATVPALQAADAMVHPDHRRNGLLTRMTERALETFAEGEGLFFNFPNEAAEEAYLRLGWREVGKTATAYRIHAPSTFADAGGFGALADAGVRRGYDGYDAAVRASARVRGRARGRGRGRPEPAVRRYDDPPVELLESLYERAPPEELHVPRTATFYSWRLSNPGWDLTTYVAEAGGEPVAALVVCREAASAYTTTKVVDALPATGAPRALERLLSAVVADHRWTDAVVVAADTLPSSVRSRLGFLRNDDPPLSLLTTAGPVVVRPFSLGGRSWSVGGRRLTDRSNWRLSLVDQDTSA